MKVRALVNNSIDHFQCVAGFGMSRLCLPSLHCPQEEGPSATWCHSSSSWVPREASPRLPLLVEKVSLRKQSPSQPGDTLGKDGASPPFTPAHTELSPHSQAIPRKPTVLCH